MAVVNVFYTSLGLRDFSVNGFSLDRIGTISLLGIFEALLALPYVFCLGRTARGEAAPTDGMAPLKLKID